MLESSSYYNKISDDGYMDYERPIAVYVSILDKNRYSEDIFSSICLQNYSNYRVVFIDSTVDGSVFSLIREQIKKYKCGDNYVVIKNDDHDPFGKFFYSLIGLCEENEIIVDLFDGIKLVGSEVLSKINRVYMDSFGVGYIWLYRGEEV